MSILERTLTALLVVALLAAAAPTAAQIPDEFTNLKVLPKDISKREMVNIMRGFAGALGVRCSHCHVGEDPNDLKTFDFASDEKEAKIVSRIMMKMSGDINNTSMAELKRDDVTRVRCVTCHRGVTKPETIDNVVLGAIEKDGLDAAVAEYRELREAYYGKGAYNFSAGPLNSLAEKLAERGDIGNAVAIAKMNVEYNPDVAFSHLLLGQLYQAAGDKAAAIASMEKAIELEPDNQWAKGLLEKLKASE